MNAVSDILQLTPMDPAVRFGKPCITGTRIDVATVLGRLAAGDKIEDIQKDYQLTRDQIMAVLPYATHVVERVPSAVKTADWTLCVSPTIRGQKTEVRHRLVCKLAHRPRPLPTLTFILRDHELKNQIAF